TARPTAPSPAREAALAAARPRREIALRRVSDLISSLMSNSQLSTPHSNTVHDRPLNARASVEGFSGEAKRVLGPARTQGSRSQQSHQPLNRSSVRLFGLAAGRGWRGVSDKLRLFAAARAV